MSESRFQHLPPCPLSIECPRFVDELDTSGNRLRVQPVLAGEDEKDARLLAELRSHVPTCPTCTATLAEARRVRQQQHAVLRDLLADSEKAVPSTVASIMQTIAREQGSLAAGTNHHQDIYDMPTLQQEEPQIISIQGRPQPVPRRPRPRRHAGTDPSSRKTRTTLFNIFSLAMVAVIIISAILILRQFVIPAPTTGNKKQPTPTTSPTSGESGWNSAVIGLSYPGADGGHITIANYDPASGQSVLLVPFALPVNAQLDTISHNGQKLLYQYAQNGHMYYATTPATSGNSFYSIKSSDAGNAIWYDNQSALIASAIQLLIYRAPYLYFIANNGSNLEQGALYRVALSGGKVQQVAPTALPGSTFWISGDGTSVFYEGNGAQGV